MATMRDVVTRAYRKIRVSGSGEALDAEETSEGLDALNDMLHEWKLRGVDISHTTKTMTDTFPLGDEYISGTSYMLAERLRPNFARPLEFDADDFFRTIQAAYMTIAVASFDKALYRVPSQLEGELEASDA